MSDIVVRLLDYSKDDHERGCQGRYYDCTCGYDAQRDPLLVEAAKTIESLRDVIALARRGAAAGDMLEALKEYACDCKGGCEADNSFDIHWKCGDAARAALTAQEKTDDMD